MELINFRNNYFEIRLESIGGLGANLISKILGELGFYMGYNSSSFSSYGIEKMGGLLKSYIRYSKENVPIRLSTPIEVPEVLAIFHSSLANNKETMFGVSENTKVIINTDKFPEEIREDFKMYAGDLYCIDALKIALETNSKINMVILGTILKVLNIPLEKIEEKITEILYKNNIKDTKNNFVAIKRGYEEFQYKKIEPDNLYEYTIYENEIGHFGYKNIPEINIIFEDSSSNNTSFNRMGILPIFNTEKCINCGLCSLYCPDIAFNFELGKYKNEKCMINKGINYNHCKGCLRCIEVCPTNALKQGYEKDIDIKNTMSS